MGAMRPWSHRSRRSGGVDSGAQDRRMNDPPTGASLSRVVRVSIKRPGLTIGVCLTLALAGLVVTARHLTFQTSSVELLPPQHIYVQRFKDYLRDFGELNDIVIAVEAPSPSRAEVYADRLATEIKRLPGAGRVAYRVDPDLFAGQALLYLSTPELDDLADKIRLHRRFIAAIRGAIRTLRATYPDVAAGATGTPALSNDEMLTAFRDSTMATLLAVALTVGALFLVMRRAVVPLVMTAVLLASLAWSLGIITATVGHLTVFSVMFISLLIGIGIDYGVYLFFRYEEELGLGRTPQQALDATAAGSGPGILFGALAAAGTFGVLMLTEFRGIQEFGFVAGIAILMAFIAMLTLFPALLVTMHRRPAPAPAATGAGGAADVPLLGHLLRRRVSILIVAAALTSGALLALPAVRFDYSRLNLQARGTESVIWERKIMESRRSGFAALATADSLPELKAKQEAFSALPAVSELVSVLKLVPADQDAKIAAVRRLAPLVADVHLGHESAVDVAAIRTALATLRHRLTIAAVEAEGRTAAATLRSARDRADALLGRLQRGDAELASRLAQVQASLRDDFAAKLDTLQDNLAPRHVTVRELPPDLTRKFIGASGRLLMLIYPAIDTWDRDGAREFVRQLRSVDAAVTGSPVISYEASRLVEAACWHGTLYAAAR